MRFAIAVSILTVLAAGVFAEPLNSTGNNSVPHIDTSSIVRGKPHQEASSNTTELASTNKTEPAAANSTADHLTLCQPGLHWVPHLGGCESWRGPVMVTHNAASSIAHSTGALAVGIAAAAALL
ncbi:hypothetical protein F5Y10DRAFT_268915 [Nemania abortiva]|nr:hypothetical protein F5Y10DRAFT_268915 [Nemania abortiva]